MISVRIRVSTRIVHIRHLHTHIRILRLAEAFTSPRGSVNVSKYVSKNICTRRKNATVTMHLQTIIW